MRPLLIAAVVALAVGCTKPCEELADRICKCTPTGSSVETCKQEVSNVIDSVDPTEGQNARCSDYLDSCVEQGGATFCEWITSEAGKVACGLAY